MLQINIYYLFGLLNSIGTIIGILIQMINQRMFCSLSKQILATDFIVCVCQTWGQFSSGTDYLKEMELKFPTKNKSTN